MSKTILSVASIGHRDLPKPVTATIDIGERIEQAKDDSLGKPTQDQETTPPGTAPQPPGLDLPVIADPDKARLEGVIATEPSDPTKARSDGKGSFDPFTLDSAIPGRPALKDPTRGHDGTDPSQSGFDSGQTGWRESFLRQQFQSQQGHGDSSDMESLLKKAGEYEKMKADRDSGEGMIASPTVQNVTDSQGNKHQKSSEVLSDGTVLIVDKNLTNHTTHTTYIDNDGTTEKYHNDKTGGSITFYPDGNIVKQQNGNITEQHPDGSSETYRNGKLIESHGPTASDDGEHKDHSGSVKMPAPDQDYRPTPEQIDAWIKSIEKLDPHRFHQQDDTRHGDDNVPGADMAVDPSAPAPGVAKGLLPVDDFLSGQGLSDHTAPSGPPPSVSPGSNNGNIINVGGPDADVPVQTNGPSERDTHHSIHTDPTGAEASSGVAGGGHQDASGSQSLIGVNLKPVETDAQRAAHELLQSLADHDSAATNKTAQSLAEVHGVASVLDGSSGSHDSSGHELLALLLQAKPDPAALDVASSGVEHVDAHGLDLLQHTTSTPPQDTVHIHDFGIYAVEYAAETDAQHAANQLSHLFHH